MSKQETVGDWMELAKAYDKAEKTTVQPYVVVTLEDNVTKERLFRYDLPREMFWKYEWVVRWRMSRLQCERPRHRIVQYLDFYDKVTGLEFGFGSLLSKLVSAKAQVTILENKKTDYIQRMQGLLFFDEKNDDVIKVLNCKIENQLQKQRELEKEIKEKVQAVSNES